MGGMMPMQYNDHDINMAMSMCMDHSSSSSSSSFQNAIINNQFDPFSLLESRYTDMTNLFGTMPTSLSLTNQFGGGDGSSLCGGYGVLEVDNKIGVDRDFCLPPLESGGLDGNNALTNNNIVDMKSNVDNSNNHRLNDSCFNGNEVVDQGFKVEDVFGTTNNNWQGENLRMGEWDLEGLMEDISSFPFLDFQVE